MKNNKTKVDKNINYKKYKTKHGDDKLSLAYTITFWLPYFNRNIKKVGVKLSIWDSNIVFLNFEMIYFKL